MEKDSQEWRSLSLKEIFSRPQAKELIKFLRDRKNAKRNPMDMTDDFKTMFRKWEHDLMKKGVLPDYLAYAFAYQLMRAGTERILAELR